MTMTLPYLTLPAVIFLFSIVSVRSSCDQQNPLLCPPQFPDFMAFFAETLALIPDLKLEIENLTAFYSADDICPSSVNWKEFNSLLDSGNPVPLNVTCSLTTSPSRTTASGTLAMISPDSGTTTTMHHPFDQSTNSTLENPGSPAFVAQSDQKQLIGLAVGLPIGALLILALIPILVTCRNRRFMCRKKDPILGRAVSTSSQSPLVPSDCTIPTTPGTPMPYTSVNEYECSGDTKKCVYLEGGTSQESSTDLTIPRLKGIAIAEEISTKTEVRPRKLFQGSENMGFDAVEEEVDDAGYAGSEVGQEIWENEINNLFESAKMDSNEDIAPTEATRQQKGTSSSALTEDIPLNFLEPTLSNRSRALFTLPSSTKITSLKLNLPSPVLDSSSPTKSPTSPQLPTFPTKSTTSPQHPPSLSKAPTSSSRSPSTAKPFASLFDSPASTKPFISSDDQDCDTLTKPYFEPESPPTPLMTPEAPPAYSSPIVKPTQTGPSFEIKGIAAEAVLPDTPTELPTYSQAMAYFGNAASSNVAPTQLPEASLSRRQKRPTPPSKVNLGDTRETQRTSATYHDKSTAKESRGNKGIPDESRPNNIRKPLPIGKHVFENPNSRKSSSGQFGDQRRNANTAVIRPRIAGTETKAVPPAACSTPLEANNAQAMTETSTGEPVVDYSFRPVRSLLSQFETVDRS